MGAVEDSSQEMSRLVADLQRFVMKQRASRGSFWLVEAADEDDVSSVVLDESCGTVGGNDSAESATRKVGRVLGVVASPTPLTLACSTGKSNDCLEKVAWSDDEAVVRNADMTVAGSQPRSKTCGREKVRPASLGPSRWLKGLIGV